MLYHIPINCVISFNNFCYILSVMPICQWFFEDALSLPNNSKFNSAVKFYKDTTENLWFSLFQLYGNGFYQTWHSFVTLLHILKFYLVGNRRYMIFIFLSLRNNLHHNWDAVSFGFWTVERFSYITAYHPDDKEVYEWISLRQNIRDLPKVLCTAASFDLEEDFFACRLGGAVQLE